MPEETRSIGYICPVCGQSVIASRTAFQLAAGDSVLPCPCGKSEVRLRQLGDRCEITVPCLFCAKDHTAVCANDALLRQALLALSCPASGLGCCHIGQEDRVFQAMAKLEPEYRQALILRVIDGLSYAEIAAATDVPEGTVKSRSARAREKMRRLLKKTGNKSPAPSSKRKKGGPG